MEGYRVTIANSSKELSAKERIKMKDTGDALSIDELTQEGDLLIDVDYYVELEVHNEKSENQDYGVLLIVSKDGNKYKTGSRSFYDSFLGIWEEMKNEEEEWKLKVYRLESKNFKGKDFLTCTVD